MTRKCCVPGCMTNASPTATDDRKRFNRPCFKFPVEDEYCKLWLERIPREGVFRTKHSGVCILHFESHFVRFFNKRYTLAKYAIPTIFDADPLTESDTNFDYPQNSTNLQTMTQNRVQELKVNHTDFNPDTDISNFDYLKSYLYAKLKLNNWMVSLSDQSILIFNLNKQSTGVTKDELSIRSTININSDLVMKVFVKGVVIFNVKIGKWDQIQKIIDKLQIKKDVDNDMGFELNNVIVVGNNIDVKPIIIGSSDPHLTLPEEGLQQNHGLKQMQSLQDNQIQEADVNCIVKIEPQTLVPEFEGFYFNEGEKQMKHVVNFNIENNDPIINTIDNTTSYTCSDCGKKFDHHIRYMLHVRRHDPKECQPCLICNKNVYGKMSRHLNTHGEKTFVCKIDECDRVFKTRSLLKEHMGFAHFPGEFYCDVCNDGKNLRTKARIRHHMQKHADSSVTKKTRVDLAKNQMEWILSKQNAKQNGFDQGEDSAHLENLCNVCGKGFPLQKQLHNHMRRHDPSKWKECPICKKRFPDGLTRHMNTHTKAKNYVCDICGFSYSQPYNLKIHKETTHFADKEYYCDICKNGNVYRSREHLRVHLRTHLLKGDVQVEGVVRSERPFFGRTRIRTTYDCIQCEAVFNTKTRLKLHTTTVHTDEKEFHCMRCNETFAKSLLDSHEKLHSENKFTCQQCGKNFKLRSYLRKHLLTHKGEANKRRICVICGKKYVSNVDLRLHMKKIHGIDRKTEESRNMSQSIQT